MDFNSILKYNLENLYSIKGLSCKKIGDIYSVSAEVVRKKLIELNIPRRNFGPSPKITFDKELLEILYQKHSMSEISKYFNCGETLIHKKIHEYGILLHNVGIGGHRKETGKIFSDAHKKNISKSLKGKMSGSDNPNYKGGPLLVTCLNCEQLYSVCVARKNSTSFCSNKCRGEWRGKYWTGSNNPRFQEEVVREKTCCNCLNIFQQKKNEPVVTFLHRKFCSNACAILGQKRYEGQEHPMYKNDARRRSYRGKHGAWQRKVLGRDEATCQHCWIKNVPLVSHHIKEFEKFPDLRWNVENGITLCEPCHWHFHGYDISNDDDIIVFDKNCQTARRWNGNCDWCGIFISKRASDLKDKSGNRKKQLFCSKSCSCSFTRLHKQRDCLSME